MIFCLSVYKSVNRLIVAAPLPLAIIRFNGVSGEERLCVLYDSGEAEDLCPFYVLLLRI